MRRLQARVEARESAHAMQPPPRRRSASLSIKEDDDPRTGGTPSRALTGITERVGDRKRIVANIREAIRETPTLSASPFGLAPKGVDVTACALNARASGSLTA